MILFLQTILFIFIIVVGVEMLWRAKLLEAEHSRKLIHILVGTFAATWGFFLSDGQILLLAGAMFLVVFGSRLLGVFSSIHSVKRKTWGELFFPLGIATCALVTDSPWIFAAAIMHVSIADGLAALVGRKHIKKYGYKILGQQKTTVGSLMFFNVSLFIVLAGMLLSPELSVNLALALAIPFLATVAENIGVFGADDLLVPMVVVSLLSGLS